MRDFFEGGDGMDKNVLPKSLFLALAGLLYVGSLHADDSHFVQTNLVSDLSGVPPIPTPMLKNPWGIPNSAPSPFWSSTKGTSTATLYAVTDKTTVAKVNINPPAGDVLIPTTATGPQGPTGQVNNS